MTNGIVELREFKAGDADLLVEYLNSPELSLHFAGNLPQPYKKSDAEWWINEGSQQGIIRAITYQGVLAGSIGIHPKRLVFSRGAEVGYWLAKKFWGLGIASQVLQRLVDIAFSTTDLVRLQATVFERNKASARVLEKSGFKLEGVLEKAVFKNGRFDNAAIYGRVKKSD